MRSAAHISRDVFPPLYRGLAILCVFGEQLVCHAESFALFCFFCCCEGKFTVLFFQQRNCKTTLNILCCSGGKYYSLRNFITSTLAVLYMKSNVFHFCDILHVRKWVTEGRHVEKSVTSANSKVTLPSVIFLSEPPPSEGAGSKMNLHTERQTKHCTSTL